MKDNGHKHLRPTECLIEQEKALREALKRAIGEGATNKEIAKLVIGDAYALKLLDFVTARPSRREKGASVDRDGSQMRGWMRKVIALWEKHLDVHPYSRDDLTHEWRSETLLRVAQIVEHKGLFGLDPEHPRFVGYLRQVIVSKAAKAASWMLKQEQKKARLVLLGESDGLQEDKTRALEGVQRRMDVQETIARIRNDRVRSVMKEYGQPTYGEIAATLGLTYDQVREAVTLGKAIVRIAMEYAIVLVLPPTEQSRLAA